MPDYRSMFDRDYLGHWDLAGRDVTVTIRDVKAGKLTAQGGRTSKKPVIYFEGKEKGLACNKSNGKTIAGMYGANTDDWIGKRITLFPTTTTFGSEVVDCIRVRPKIPAEERRPRNGARQPEPEPDEPPSNMGPTPEEVDAERMRRIDQGLE